MTISALWWPNIWPKMGFPELRKKWLAYFILYLAFTLFGWVSWTLFIFVFLASILALSGAKYVGKNRVSGIKKNPNYSLNSFDTSHLLLWGESLHPFSFLCSYRQFWPPGPQIFGWKWGFHIFSCNQAALRTLLSVCPSVCLSHLFHYVPPI